MLSAQSVWFSGNAASAPELNFGSSGVARCSLVVMCSDRYRGEDGEWKDTDVYGQRVIMFRDLAERVAASVQRGDRIVVGGSFRRQEYTNDAGEQKYSTDFIAEEVALSCRWAEVRSQRVKGSRGRHAAPDEFSTGGGLAPADDDPQAAKLVRAVKSA